MKRAPFSLLLLLLACGPGPRLPAVTKAGKMMVPVTFTRTR